MESASKKQKTEPTSIEIWDVPAVEATERSALTHIYDQLNGKHWHQHTNWNTKSPLASWHGVQTNTQGRVTALILSENNLSGRLELVTHDLLRLTELSQLWLSNNRLTGPLPGWLASRTKLVHLDVGSNQLIGALSPAFFNSTTLSWFDYVGGGNQLTCFWRSGTPTTTATNTGTSSTTSTTTASTTPSPPTPSTTTSSSSTTIATTVTKTTPTSTASFNHPSVHVSKIIDTTTLKYPSLWNVNTIPTLLSPEECNALIQEAEAFTTSQGWSKSRHRDYSTTDVDVSRCPTLLTLCNAHLQHTILPVLASLYGFQLHELGVEDMFVAKYEMSGQRALVQHRDGSELSFVIALNCKEYEGGGTLFINAKYDEDCSSKAGGAGGVGSSSSTLGCALPKTVLIRPNNVGDCVMFCGGHLHSGQAITSGVRYILTGFVRVYVEDEKEGKEEKERESNGKVAEERKKRADMVQEIIHFKDRRRKVETAVPGSGSNSTGGSSTNPKAVMHGSTF